MKIALLAKQNKPFEKDVAAYLQNCFGSVSVFTGSKGDPYPDQLRHEPFDMIFSWLSPWIVPEITLKLTRKFNINFHPGSPEYPGIGCFNFAIYNGETVYGVTAHLMEAQVDTGRILGVNRFPVEGASVYSLSLKSYDAMYELFCKIVDHISNTGDVPETRETWQRLPYRREELEALCVIDLDMDAKEIQKRVHATTYPGMPGAFFVLHDLKFEYNPDR